MKYEKDNSPNAGRLIESLRHLGYDNYEAIADIVDNSIDANATELTIQVGHKNSETYLLIADNGHGMSLDVLDQALHLGSETTRDIGSDLGKFGMGLVTASLSIARNCQVITRCNEGIYTGGWDVDAIIQQNAFVKNLDVATLAEEQQLNDILGLVQLGTVVILTKCDLISNRSNTTLLAKTLGAHLSRVHRHFLRAGLKIRVNGELLEPVDPLQGDQGETVFEESIPVKVGAISESVRVKVVLVPQETASEREIGRSMKHQGFYVMRNQRELMNAVTLDMFTKHNDFNRMRGEIYFPGALDQVVGIEFTKRQVKLDQSLHDQLKEHLMPLCRQIKRREASKNRVQLSDEHRKHHAQSEKLISEKEKLLIRPKAQIEKRNSPTTGGNQSPKEVGSSKERSNLSRTQAIESQLKCEIREERLGVSGSVYECHLEGRKIVIRYNVEHPFFQKFVVDNVSDGRLISVADFLIFSMASAELKLVEEDQVEFINTFKMIMSSNLRTLLN